MGKVGAKGDVGGKAGDKDAGGGKAAQEKPSAATMASAAGSAQAQASNNAPPRATVTLDGCPVILPEQLACKDKTLCATAGTHLDASGKRIQQVENDDHPGEGTAQRLPSGPGSPATAATPPVPAGAPGRAVALRLLRERSESEESSSESDGKYDWIIETAAERRKRVAAQLAARTETWVEYWERPVPTLSFSAFYRDPGFFWRNNFTDESGHPLFVSTRKLKDSAAAVAPGGGAKDDDEGDDDVVIIEPGDPGYEEPPAKPSTVCYLSDGSDEDSDSSQSDESVEGRGAGTGGADRGTGRHVRHTTDANL